jgi:lipopolysaccharide transport system ATP-binding protein
MSDDTLIKVEGVSKKFCRSLKKSLWYGMQDLGNEIRGHRHGGNGELREDEFWAVKDVSFELKRGECLGLIGRNGAGKTTLLRMLNGLIKPDAGRIEMRGRVGALIALGAGFNPILTGRENIYVNASVLGLKKRDIDASLDEIVDFAEIGEFIDMPVQSYSSGMAVRLGFSVASTLKPDVLLLDEVLAVGDAAFRAKCYRRLSAMIDQAAVIVVSHSMEQIGQVSSRVLLMQTGRNVHDGEVEEGIRIYNQVTSSEAYFTTDTHQSFGEDVKIHDIVCSDVTFYGGSFEIDLDIEFRKTIDSADIKVTLFDTAQQPAAESYTKSNNLQLSFFKGNRKVRVRIGPLFLREGIYFVSIVLLNRKNNEHLFWGSRSMQFQAKGPAFGSGVSLPPIAVYSL